MTPDETISAVADDLSAAALPCAIPPALHVLKERRSFQRLSRGKRVVMPGFILQMGPRPEDAPDGIGIGFTCSKKVGNAVARNRAKRRLREIARLDLPTNGQTAHNYVLVGRNQSTASLPFDALQADFRRALGILHGRPA